MREQFNCRLPGLTKQQIGELAERLGLTQSEVVMLAVDRLLTAVAAPPAYRAAQVKEATLSMRSPPA